MFLEKRGVEVKKFKIFMNLLDLIFPKTCVSCNQIGDYLCSSCVSKIEPINHQICPVCRKEAISGLAHPKCNTKFGLDGLYSFLYFSPPLPQALYKLKYKFVKDFSDILINKSKLVFPDVFKNYYLAPIPLHEAKKNWRGFNQVEMLADLLSDKYKINQAPNVIVRKKATKSQVGLTKVLRAENLRSAFECVDKKYVKDKKFLLFDDVWTSGATLKNAGAVLKRAGAKKVWGLTLARAR